MTSLVRGDYSLLVVGILTFCTALFVLYKNPKSPVHRSFFVFAAGGACWLWGIAGISLTDYFLVFCKLVDYGGLAFVVGFFLLAKSIPVPMQFRIPPWFLYLPIAIDALWIAPMSLVNLGIHIHPDGSIVPIPGPQIIPHSLIVLLYTFAGIAILAYKHRHSAGIEQLRIKYLALGTGIFMATAVMFDAVLPAAGIASFNLLGPLSSVLFVGIVGYAIIRHQLLEIRIIIQRGIVYGLLFSFLAGLYLGILNLIGLFADKTSNFAILETGGLTIIIGVLSIPFLDRKLRKLTDKFFYKDPYDHAEILRKLSEVIYSAETFEDVISSVQETMRRLLKNESVSIIFLEDGTLGKPPFDTQPATALAYMPMLRVPINLKGQEIGSILCGRKRSGENYTPADVKLIETLMYQTATALGRARLYHEAKRHAETLELKVSERTEELRKAHESQRQTMVDISHNLQTPLAIFQTQLEDLKRVMRDHDSIPALETSLRDLTLFIDNLLMLAHLEHAPASEERTTFDVSGIVSDIVEQLSTISELKGVRVDGSIEPEVRMHGNKREIREAFLNIASNALKYLGNGTRIGITLKREGDSLLFTVTDDGLGISAEDQKRLFQRFYRVKKAGRPTGTGLGLAITKQIVSLHNGSIWCESIEGTGSTFCIRLPVAP